MQTIKIIFLLGILLHFAPARAETAPLPMGASWVKVMWNGFNIADLFTEIEKNGEGRYAITAVIKSYGLAHAVSRYESNTSAEVKKIDNAYIPVIYDSYFKLQSKERTIKIAYDKVGNIASESDLPTEDRNKRPEVAPTDKNGAANPLTAFFIIRHKIMEGKEKNFTVPIYDGRRLSNLIISNLGQDEGGAQGNLIHITLREEYVAGFTKNEKREREDHDPTIHIYVDPKNYLPVKAMGISILGKAYGKLERQCPTLKECMDLAERGQGSGGQ